MVNSSCGLRVSLDYKLQNFDDIYYPYFLACQCFIHMAVYPTGLENKVFELSQSHCQIT